MCSQYALRIPAIDYVCLLWYGVTYDSGLSYIIQACVIDVWCRLCCLWWMYIQWLILLNTWYLICVSYIPLIAHVWCIYHRSMEHINDWYCILRIVIVSPHDACSSCYHSITHVLHVIGLCIMLRCDTVLYEVWDHRYHSISTRCDSPTVFRDRYTA